jgi:2-oxoglutarate ferredoxin oxidoreductase subunit beta
VDVYQLSNRTELEPPWCAGCGHFAALGAVDRALSNLGIAEEDLAIVAAPGCAAWVAEALRGTRIEAPPGLALPIALGTHLARPDLRILAVAGDTDAFATGLAHLNPVAARRPDFTLAVFDNGTAGWWGEAGSGRREREPRNSLALAVASGASFVAQAPSSDAALSEAILVEALGRPGFSIVLLKTACVAFNANEGDAWLAARAKGVPPGHDRTQLSAALRLASDSTTLWTGVLYRADPSGAPPARRDPS